MMGILLRGRQAGRQADTRAQPGEPATSPVQTYTCAGGLGVCARAQSHIIPVVAGLKLDCSSELYHGGRLRQLAKK